MKFATLLRTLLGVILSTLGLACASTRAPLASVPSVDPARYAGLWYEVARLPNPFQKDNERATAEYIPTDDGRFLVKNTGIKPNGKSRTISGIATPVPGSGNARLKVAFTSFPASLVKPPEEGNYWIIDLSPDYQTAIVASPDRRFLWILARSPALPAKKYDALIDRARELGFNTSRLVTPPEGAMAR